MVIKLAKNVVVHNPIVFDAPLPEEPQRISA